MTVCHSWYELLTPSYFNCVGVITINEFCFHFNYLQNIFFILKTSFKYEPHLHFQKISSTIQLQFISSSCFVKNSFSRLSLFLFHFHPVLRNIMSASYYYCTAREVIFHSIMEMCFLNNLTLLLIISFVIYSNSFLVHNSFHSLTDNIF